MAQTISRRRRRQTYVDGRSVSMYGEEEDPDTATNEMLFRDQKTWSKGRIQRMKIMSAFAGNIQPSRRKIFTSIQIESDYKLYGIAVHNMTISCAKVFNPALLEKNSKTWSKLMHVQRFELEDPEGILSTIPKHYATNLANLESFSITWARVKSIPTDLFRDRLKTLNLQRNQIKTLNGIEKAENLSNLDVSSNLLTELPKTFGLLRNLITLNISGNAIRELPENFGALSQLKFLDCSCNRLGFLPESICNLIDLTSLDVSNNNLITLPESISYLPRLEDLRARANQLESLPQKFGNLIKLTSLILRKNKFVNVPLQLSSIPSLSSLNLRDNLIESFSDAIPSLRTLIIDSNKLKEMSDALLGCSNLLMLSLENNEITSIPQNIKNIKNLRVLHLCGNEISEVPEDIGDLANLRHLGLRNTQIKRLPNAILHMKELVKLDLNDCPELENYLRLAYRDGGLAQVREEMLQAHNNDITTNTTCGNRISRIPSIEEHNIINPAIESNDDKPTVIQVCKRGTVILDCLPDQLSDLAEKLSEQHNGQAVTNRESDISNLTTVDGTSEERKSGTSEANENGINNTVYGSVQKKVGPPTKPKKGTSLKDSDPNYDSQCNIEIVGFGNIIREKLPKRELDVLNISKRQSKV